MEHVRPQSKTASGSDGVMAVQEPHFDYPEFLGSKFTRATSPFAFSGQRYLS